MGLLYLSNMEKVEEIKSPDRVRKILTLLAQGRSEESVGSYFKLTRQRISAIILRHGKYYPKEWKSYQETKKYLSAKGRKY